jgi:hypothetical protein
MKHRDRILLGVAVITGFIAPVGAFALPGGPAMAAPSSTAPMAYTCTGGDFASGNLTKIHSGIYASITVTGACAPLPNAVIIVIGNLNVASGAVLDAQSAPSTIAVGHDVNAAAGSLLGLGCLPNPPGHFTGHPCAFEPLLHSNITIFGNINASHANTVLLNGITVKKNVRLIGGGDHAGNPWPIKNNTIGGNLLVVGATPEWVGVLLNKIGGDVMLTNITIAPGETIQVTLNTIRRNLICSGLAPAVAPGAFPGEFNTIGGQEFGQCAHFPEG